MSPMFTLDLCVVIASYLRHRETEPKKNYTELQRHRLEFGAPKAVTTCDQSMGEEQAKQKRSSEVCVVVSHEFLIEG